MAPLNPLVSTEWLAAHLYDEDIRIADCRFYLDDPNRGHVEYLAGHVPGARYFSLDGDLTATTGPGRHPLPDAAVFSEAVGRLGIGEEHTVVVYDDSSGAIAARLWWMLRSLGHAKSVVLDGGWSAWAAEHHSVSIEIPDWPRTEFVGSTAWAGTMDQHAIVESREGLVLIDARAAARYRGEAEPIDPIAGHIPGAINIPYQANVDPTGHFLPPEVLADRFADAGSDAIVVVYCGSGVTACHNLLAMEVAGHRDGLLYPGSWSDWCTTGGPIAKG